MTPLARSVLIAAIGVIAVGGALYLIQPRLGPGGRSSTPPTASPVPPSIEGTWEADFTRAEMLAAGLADQAEDNAGNYGHFRLTIGNGAFEIRQLDGPQDGGSGRYSTTGGSISLTFTTGEVETFVMPFTVTATSLTFGTGGPVTFRVEPWIRATGAAPAPTDIVLVPATQLPDPAGAALGGDLIGRRYAVNPAEILDNRQMVLTLRAADDPHCLAMFGGRSTCFTVLWDPVKPNDPAARGSARIVDGNLVISMDLVPFDLACVGQSATYAVEDAGATLRGIDPPACTFPGFVQLR